MKPETYNRFIWPIKQLLPFKYQSTFKENGKRKTVEWRMFLGRCFNIKEVS